MRSYRESAAEGIICRCVEVGVALVANGTGVHAVPTGKLNKYPGLVFMIARYRREIMLQLAERVE